MHIAYWNINSIRSKTENDDILKLLTNFDIFWISELKTNSDIHIPGYKCFRNNQRYDTHGGIALFVKYSLVCEVKEVEYVKDDAVLVSFVSAPNVVFSGWYIPPSDSKYADNHTFASMSSLLHDEDRDVVLLGDFNAKIQERDVTIKNTLYTYTSNDHPQNYYGEMIQCIAKENELVLINGLKMKNYSFDDSLTYRKKSKWISRLDLMFCSENMIKSIDNFEVIQGNCNLLSDHAVISCSLSVSHNVNLSELLQRALWLNEYEVPIASGKRGIKYNDVDADTFQENLGKIVLPELSINTLDTCIDFLAHNMHACAEQSLLPPKEWDTSIERWRRLIDSNNPRDIWYAINWKGELNRKENKTAPPPEEFKSHFEKLLLTDSAENVDSISTDSSPYVPLLDDPITRQELTNSIHEIKPNKACDRNGNSPGFIKLFTPAILLFLLNLFNTILQSSLIPVEWTVSKLISLFKRGKTSVCGNYRGIAINDILFRLFDRIIGKRLSLWYQPCKEQAGAQKGRDCVEHIMTVRLLIDYARKSRKKLYILFIDFEKAYDKVERTKLINLLKSAGCGKIMLEILKAIYRNTKFLFRMVVISANLGVKQGSSASCLLFIVYVDKMIKMIKMSFEDDGFLGALHVLMLMDDTILFATTRDKVIKKFHKCQDFCAEYGMSINETKTKFMVINRGKGDEVCIRSRGINVEYCQSYIYLGAPITQNGSYITMINLHVKDKMKHAIKFYTFLNRNPDVPFPIKKRVAEACVFSSILYGTETWFTDNYGKAETLYNKIVKALLGVRQTTCNDICHTEAGMPSFQTIVQKKMQKYLQNKIPNLDCDDPLWVALELNRTVNSKSYQKICTMLHDQSDIKKDEELRNERLRQSSSSKRSTYCAINPELKPHSVYKSDTLKEYQRIEFTRFRVSSHNLKVETGRWGRVARENRTCPCDVGGIQDEEHVVFKCGLTKELRDKYKIRGHQLKDLYNELEDETLCSLFYNLSRIFEK